MIYVYRRHASTGARELSEALEDGGTGARRVRSLDAITFRAGDTVICWGETFAGRPGVRVINGAPLRNKFEDARRLIAAGVPTVEVRTTRPPAPVAPVRPPAVDPARATWTEVQDVAGVFAGLDFARTPVSARAVSDLEALVRRLHNAILIPPPAVAPPAPPRPQGEWLPRTLNHQGGLDLLNSRRGDRAEYYSKKEDLIDEYRIHLFNGRSIRAGRKVPREGMRAHPWIRSYDGGWRINYDGFESTRDMRDLAQRSVEALNLQFGAVDLGRKRDGTLVVLEVNRAPGLEGGTVTSYATAVARMVQGEAPRGNTPRRQGARRR